METINEHSTQVKVFGDREQGVLISALVRIMMEYWRQCALWLINCKVLPANHRVTWESAQVFDLAQTLRDGVLLCHLLNNLRPQSINLKEINLRPQMSQVSRAVPSRADPHRAASPAHSRESAGCCEVPPRVGAHSAAAGRNTEPDGLHPPERKQAGATTSRFTLAVVILRVIGTTSISTCRFVYIVQGAQADVCKGSIAMHLTGAGTRAQSELTFRSVAKETSPRHSQPFLCLKNIRTFLAACNDAFGMKKSELFEAFDLFDVRDFGKTMQILPHRSFLQMGREMPHLHVLSRTISGAGNKSQRKYGRATDAGSAVCWPGNNGDHVFLSTPPAGVYFPVAPAVLLRSYRAGLLASIRGPVSPCISTPLSLCPPLYVHSLDTKANPF
ncbi:Guanine nucleotide exchange factor VAV3 [Liparis tanakae]|uniref:Guanine nucleotide exchange factor VAV3 n=2 Tax=Eupercaria TaxID=1489922 RepID=A0A4Z2I4L7_9TELE|nr:Guanine nucleotide exchange factor VAV3 [Liparis tanakae]